ncbi:MAG: hypothetical protein V9E96_05705 [Chitinophagaceae bacterium]
MAKKITYASANKVTASVCVAAKANLTKMAFVENRIAPVIVITNPAKVICLTSFVLLTNIY